MPGPCKVVFDFKTFQSAKLVKYVKAEGFESLLKHSHNFVEMVYVEAGEAKHCVGDNKYRVKSGDLIVIREGVEHSYIPYYRDNDFQISNFIFPSDLLPEIVGELAPVSEINILGNERMQFLLAMLREECQNEKVENNDLLKAAAALILTIFRAECVARVCAGKRQNADKIIEEVCEYLKANSDKHITLEMLAKQFYCSQNTLMSLFRKHRDTTIYQYLLKLRVERACELLIRTELSNEEIAQKVGFEDFRNFYKYFKSIVGVSPKQYKTMTRQENE